MARRIYFPIVSGSQSETHEKLAQRVALGDRRAFLELYDLCSPKVYGLALKIMGDAMAAEEVTQDAFLKLWTRAETFRAGRGSFMAWLLTITRHTALDRFRRESRRPDEVDPPDSDSEWAAILDDPQSSTEEARWRSLHFAIQALPDEQRRVIQTAYFHGMSHREISAYLGVPIGTVKTRLRLGMENLRRAWITADEGPGRKG